MTAAGGMLDGLRERALQASRSGSLEPEASTVRGLWKTSYVVKLAPTSSLLHLDYVVVQTRSQGCCYFERRSRSAPQVQEDMIGQDVLATRFDGSAWDIAALDAVYADLCGPPEQTYAIEGTNVEKALCRAQVVCDAVLSLADQSFHGRDRAALRVLNVGVVGDFLAILGRAGVRLQASDFFEGIVGTHVHDVMVRNGSETLALVAEADIALVTGMTLANGTFDEILATAKRHGTRVVVFAQTGAHFATAYREIGVEVVVSEPQPFYLSGPGPSELRVYA
jgi:Putative heavy-metal chelation